MSTTPNTSDRNAASDPSWADNEFHQPDGTIMFTSDPVACHREGAYQLDVEQYWSTDAPAAKAHLVITPHLDELELAAAGVDQLLSDLTAVRDALRAADREAGL